MTRFSEATDTVKLYAVSLLILTIGFFLWYQYLYTNPTHVFWSAVNNGLQTTGATRSLNQQSNDGALNQHLQLQLGANNLVSGKTVVEQTREGQTLSRVVTDEIGTPSANYSRYQDISVPAQNGQQPNLDSVLNKWGKTDLTQGGQAQSSFSELVYGVLPLGRLNHGQRQELLELMQEKKVYTIDFTKVTSEKLDGRSVFKYDAEITPEAYIAVLQRFDEMMNLKQLEGINPSSYANSPPFKVSIFVDKYAHQLVKLEYATDSTRQETYAGYGIQPQVTIPAETIPRPELEAQFSQLLQ